MCFPLPCLFCHWFILWHHLICWFTQVNHFYFTSWILSCSNFLKNCYCSSHCIYLLFFQVHWASLNFLSVDYLSLFCSLLFLGFCLVLIWNKVCCLLFQPPVCVFFYLLSESILSPSLKIVFFFLVKGIQWVPVAQSHLVNRWGAPWVSSVYLGYHYCNYTSAWS